jgi:hypothetical protein
MCKAKRADEANPRPLANPLRKKPADQRGFVVLTDKLQLCGAQGDHDHGGGTMKYLRSQPRSAALAALLALQFVSAHAAGFSYHGTLQDAGKPAEGSYDLELTLYTAASGGKVLAGPLLLYKVAVHAGAFSTSVDFGPLAIGAESGWLDVAVRASGENDFTALSSRAVVSANPNSTVCPGAWTLFGNSGTTPGTSPGQNYLGTSDNTPFVIAVNGTQAAQLTSSSNFSFPDASNIVLGSPGNFAGAGIGGATVSGGGSVQSTCGLGANLPCVNSATGLFSTVGGGNGNSAVGGDSTIAGGFTNRADGGGAFIGGGSFITATGGGSVASGGDTNSASGTLSVVAGGTRNTSSATQSAIGGGTNNVASGVDAFIGGGAQNTASGGTAVVGGGSSNTSSGFINATVSGGESNTASGAGATVPGGFANVAGGDMSFAAGSGAQTRDAAGAGNGATCSSVAGTCGDYSSFVWSDGSSFPFATTGARQFLVQAAGGMAFNTNVPAPNKLTIAGPSGPIMTGFASAVHSVALFENNAAGYVETLVPANAETGTMFSLVGSVADGGVYYNAGNNGNGLSFRANGNADRMRITSTGATQNTTGSWTTFSDARLKRDITAIDRPLDTLLGLHGQTFEYIDPPQAMAQPGRRMGFVAQEVEKVLPQWVGEDERGYKMVTPTGFEALSVEALRELRAEKDAEIATLNGKLDAMEARLHKLEAAR